MNKVTKNKKQFIMDKLLILLAVICVTLGLLIITLYLDNPEISIFAENTDNIKESYTSTEDTSSTNIWDISATENDNVIATLSDDGILTISGTGVMKDWVGQNDTTDWHIIKEQIKSVILKNGVRNIGKYAFYKCNNLTSIEISDTVTNIEENAISHCNGLTNIEIPESVIQINSKAFYLSNSLKRIEVNDNNKNYMDDNGVLYTKDRAEIIKYPPQKEGNEYTILEGTTKIGDYSFSLSKSLKSIIIPDSVIDIGDSAFSSCSFTNINIPDGVISIGEDAFNFCSNLISIKIPNGVIKIGDTAFYYCYNLTNIEIPESVIEIGNDVFFNCTSLKSIKVDENNKKYMDDDGVLYTKDTTELIKYPVQRIGTEYSILKGITKIEYSTFFGCINLEKVEIPESVRTVEGSAFSGCSNLTDIVIPSSVTEIVSTAFNGCSKLTIICKSGTEAETYAKNNNINYTIDNTVPTLTSQIQETLNTITINIKAIDEFVGINENSYKYYIKEENGTYSEVIPNSTEYTFTNLKSNTKYVIKVEVSDKVGNVGSKEIEVKTLAMDKITSETLTVDEENLVVKGIQPNTRVEQIKKLLQSEMEFEIINNSGLTMSELSTTATGYKIKLENNKTYTVIVTGDADGDGLANIDDILAINKHRLNKAPLTSEYLEASDVDGNGVADISDILQINKFRLGKTQTL